MLLVDAVYINDGGGKVLLDLLIKRLSEQEQDIFYLLDERVRGQYDYINANKVVYIPNSFKKRLDFYRSYGIKFCKVLTFGNIPPPIKLKAVVYTYFHNVLYLNSVKGLKLVGLLLRLKVFIISFFSKNTDFWFVQSQLMKDKVVFKFGIDPDRIKVLPIFDELIVKDRLDRIQPDTTNYLYVSDGHPYKNHYNLINAFVKFYKNSEKKNSLTVTISSKYANLCSFIEDLRNQGIDIANRGIVSKVELAEEYQKADLAIYPSLSESFGLGLVEAAQYGLPVIGADLSYLHEVIEPSIVFDPTSVDDIYRAFWESLGHIGKPVKLKAKNGLNKMIDIIIKNNESNI